MTPAKHVDLELIRIASLLERDPRAAAHEAAQLLRTYPGHPTVLLLLGNAHRACGDWQEAATELGELAAAQPHSAVIALELGRALLSAGRGIEALVALERAVALAPDLAEGWRQLSLLHAARDDAGRCDDAYGHFEKLARDEERLVEAAAALDSDRLDSAQALLNRALTVAPEDVVALRLSAQLAAAREDYVQAERLLAQCLRLAPGYGRARVDLVKVLHAQGKAEPMLPLLERLLSAEPRNQTYRTFQASAYNLLGRVDSSLQILDALVRESPGSELCWLNYGHALRIAGRGRDAIAAYRKCIELRPQSGSAWMALANLKTYRFSPGDVAAMRAQLAQEQLGTEDGKQLEFALGKALEDAGDFVASFAHYARGNELHRARISYDPGRMTRIVQRAQALYTREFFGARAGWGHSSPAPIFIVGLPRAGSTLLEQILASHSQVEGTRELTEVLQFAMELGDGDEEHDVSAAYPQSIARLRHGDLAALGERYLAETRALRLLGRPRFIDKMGSNFLHLGLIHLMLPNARIIDARRAPLGCCFANFKQHFQRSAWFSYSLEDLGRFYRDYVTLMSHFDAVLPGRIHRVHYEELVGNLEGEVRRLLAYCGLPFEEQCLRFHETRRAVQTVSAEQVREPLYTEGLRQWRNFEPWLGPLKQALGDLA